MPAGPRAMPLWSNVERMVEFAFEGVDPTYPKRASATGDHATVGGRNHGQGSSREQAALAPRLLGLRVVIALHFARIHHENLVLFGILPLSYGDGEAYEAVETGHVLLLEHPLRILDDGALARNLGDGGRRRVLDRWSWRHTAERTVDQYRMLLAGHEAPTTG